MATLIKRKEITAALNSFYQRPVAMVSLELLLSLGLVTFLAVFAIQPTLMTMSNLIQERKEKIELVKKLQNKSASLQSAQLLYQQVLPELPALNEAIPPQPQLMRSLKIIEKLAAENDVVILSMGVGSIPSEELISDPAIKVKRIDLPVRINVTGDFLKIRAFIQALQNSRRSYIVDNVNISLEESRGTRSLKTNIGVTMPYMGVPAL